MRKMRERVDENTKLNTFNALPIQMMVFLIFSLRNLIEYFSLHQQMFKFYDHTLEA